MQFSAVTVLALAAAVNGQLASSIVSDATSAVGSVISTATGGAGNVGSSIASGASSVVGSGSASASASASGSPTTTVTSGVVATASASQSGSGSASHSGASKTTDGVTTKTQGNTAVVESPTSTSTPNGAAATPIIGGLFAAAGIAAIL